MKPLPTRLRFVLPGYVLCPNVQFGTKRASLVLSRAVPAAHLCSYNLQQCDAIRDFKKFHYSPKVDRLQACSVPVGFWGEEGDGKGERGNAEDGGKGNGNEVGPKGKRRWGKGKGTKGMSVSCLVNIGRLLRTCSDFKFSVDDSLELSGIQYTPPRQTRHR